MQNHQACSKKVIQIYFLKKKTTLRIRMEEDFIKYLKLRDEVDLQCERLGRMHAQYMICSLGCDSCCMNFSLLPIEFFSIQKAIEGNNPPAGNGQENDCPFLIIKKVEVIGVR